MNCPGCQAPNRDGARFCRSCGGPLATVCPACGATVEADSRFCDSCGASRGGPPGVAGPAPAAAPGPAPSERFAAPERYTPAHLAEKIRSAKAHLEGERKQITVLFADIKGSLELLGDRDPEDAQQLLDSVVTLMMEAVHRYEGTVSKVLGDGVMCLFGAPLAHEDHAVRACFAALAMQEAVGRHSESLRARYGVTVQIRVGLNSGEVVVRAIGQDLNMDYSAIGQTVHLAARMEQTAVPGTVQLTGNTLRRAEGFVDVKSRGDVPVKGLPAPVEVFELLGVGAARQRLQATAARGLTRFVGREAELSALTRALADARGGRGSVVAFSGEPGVGKSRLFWEFIRSDSTQGWLVLEASSISYGKATPYLPVIDLLKRYFQVQDRDDRQAVADKLRGRLLALDPALSTLVPALSSLLDLPVSEEAWARLTPSQRRQRTLEALRRLVLRESQVQPVLLVFEDMHWVDSETQAFLDGLRDALADARVLLLINYRPEYELPWAGKPGVTEVVVTPLGPEVAGRLLDSMVGRTAEAEPLKRFLIERTAGNPFFLEESVRDLSEAGVLAGSPGAYQVTRPPTDIEVPATVQGILAARIDRLRLDDKALLQAAAVIGKDISLSVLRAIFGRPDPDLQAGVARLKAAHFLLDKDLYPDVEYTFAHALTRQVAYEELLREQRRRLHGAVMAAIESLYGARLPEQVDKLAHHAYHGELWDKALSYCWQAARKAADRCAYREAVADFDRAVEALGRLPEHPEAETLALDLRLSLRSALVPLGEFDKVIALLEETQERAEDLGDRHRLAEVHGFMSQAFSWVGDHRRAIAAGLRARACGVLIDDVALRIVGQYRVSYLYRSMGEYRASVALLERALEALEGQPPQERFGLSGLPSVLCRISLVWALAELGRFPEALQHADEALRIARQANHPFDLINALTALGFAYFRKGDLAKAQPPFAAAVDLIQAAETPAQFSSVGIWLGLTYAMGGRLDEGLQLVDEAATRHIQAHLIGARSLLVGGQADGYLLAGRLDEAEAFARQAVELAIACSERGYEAWALRALGEVAGRRDPPVAERAGIALRQALTLAEELGMRPLRAHCHLGLGRVLRVTDSASAATQHLEMAGALFGDMDMRGGRDRVDVELAHLG